jgi:leader peptidase (prepilin peptidase)/N-methyltransferase
MNLVNISEHLMIYLFVILLSLTLTVAGSLWIDRLYLQEQDSTLLSFPEQVTKRARYRHALLFLLLFFCIGKAWSSFSLPILFYYVAAIVFLSFVVITDFEQYVIFDSMLLPFSIIGLCYTAHMNLPLFNHIAAALGGGLLFLLLAIATRGAIGGGDIKLIAAMGLWLGIRPLLGVIAYGFLAGGIAALFLLLTRQKQRHDYFAYGPYFALSGIGLLLKWLRIIF